MKNNEVIAVIMPVYNGERYLAEAIESVLAQTYQFFELIVVNDGSTDRSKEIAEQYAALDSRVHVISHENMGMGKSLNKALHMTDCDWVARLDADDLMEPIRLERQCAFIQDNPNTDVISSFVKIIDGDGKVIAKATSDLTTRAAVDRLYRTNELVGFHHPAVMMRKSAVMDTGGFRSCFWPAEDIDLWNRMLEKGFKVLVQPEFLTRYRVHGGSVSIAKAMEARRKVDWLKKCLLSRREHVLEPTWEEFCESEKDKPFVYRMNQRRKNNAKVFYKAAAYNYSVKKYPLAVCFGLLSVLLQPSYIVGKLVR